MNYILTLKLKHRLTRKQQNIIEASPPQIQQFQSTPSCICNFQIIIFIFISIFISILLYDLFLLLITLSQHSFIYLLLQFLYSRFQSHLCISNYEINISRAQLLLQYFPASTLSDPLVGSLSHTQSGDVSQELSNAIIMIVCKEAMMKRTEKGKNLEELSYFFRLHIMEFENSSIRVITKMGQHQIPIKKISNIINLIHLNGWINLKFIKMHSRPTLLSKIQDERQSRLFSSYKKLINIEIGFLYRSLLI